MTSKSLSKPDIHSIHVQDGQLSQYLIFSKSDLHIGRLPDNDVVLIDKKVSKYHAQITFGENAEMIVTDLDSANGVWVNGVQISQRSRIILGDIIRISRYSLSIMNMSASTQLGSDRENEELVTESDIRKFRPSTSSLRKLLNTILVTDSDLERFCLDYFPGTKQHFSNGMDRIAKTNILLERESKSDILENLQRDSPERCAAESAILVYESFK